MSNRRGVSWDLAMGNLSTPLARHHWLCFEERQLTTRLVSLQCHSGTKLDGVVVSRVHAKPPSPSFHRLLFATPLSLEMPSALSKPDFCADAAPSDLATLLRTLTFASEVRFRSPTQATKPKAIGYLRLLRDADDHLRHQTRICRNMPFRSGRIRRGRPTSTTRVSLWLYGPLVSAAHSC